MSVLAEAQTTVYSQGFETGTNCTNWGYSGGVVTTETRRTGANALRIGRMGESNTVTFNTVAVNGLAGLQLRFYHSVRGGAGPGMDTGEGAVVQVQVNGGAWTTIDEVSGFGDYNWAWTTAVGGNPTSGCLRTMPNPMIQPLPPANTFAFRIFSTFGGCPGATAGSYDRTDEGLFIDDISLTTTTTPLPFIWSGTVNTDWHNCNNWRYGAVPGPTHDVLIDQTAANPCEVFSANAQCASLVLTTTNTVVRNLTIRNGRQLNVTNDVEVLRTGAGAAIGITLGTSGTGTLSCADLSLTGNAAGSRTAFVRNEVGTNGLLVRGDLRIGSGGHLDLAGATAGGILQLQGDFTNADNEAAFDEQFSLVWFSGSAEQTVSTAGFEERFGSLRMGKSAGDVTLEDAISVRAAVIFSYASPGGRIISNNAAPNRMFTLESTATATNPTDGSHVDGPVQKFGTANVIFPIGKAGVYRPAQLTNTVGSATDSFIAEYFTASARGTYSPLVEVILSHVSDCEYWSIERGVGTATSRVHLSWHTTLSCGVTVPAELRVAWFDAVQPTPRWLDRGNNGATSTAWGGWVPSGEVQQFFGPYTLASITANNPLPIELLHFDAEPDGMQVHCTWATATERDNDHFTVERSADGMHFLPVARVDGAGTSWVPLQYDWFDGDPLMGLSYYRLRQTDLDGTYTFSQMVPVHFTAPRTELLLLRSDEGLDVVHGLPEPAVFTVYDAAGRICIQRPVNGTRVRVDLDALAPGVHVVVIASGERMHYARFVR